MRFSLIVFWQHNILSQLSLFVNIKFGLTTLRSVCA